MHFLENIPSIKGVTFFEEKAQQDGEGGERRSFVGQADEMERGESGGGHAGAEEGSEG